MKDPYSRIINPKKLTKKHPQSGSTSNRLTTNTAIKDQTILRRFLLDKKNGSKSQITQESQLKHNKTEAYHIRYTSVFTQIISGLFSRKHVSFCR